MAHDTGHEVTQPMVACGRFESGRRFSNPRRTGGVAVGAGCRLRISGREDENSQIPSVSIPISTADRLGGATVARGPGDTG